jgi:hypothetical protein
LRKELRNLDVDAFAELTRPISGSTWVFELAIETPVVFKAPVPELTYVLEA